MLKNQRFFMFLLSGAVILFLGFLTKGYAGEAVVLPVVSMSLPIDGNSFKVGPFQENIDLAGGTKFKGNIRRVTWINRRGGNGRVENLSGDWTSWSVPGVPLEFGENEITITAYGPKNVTGTKEFVVTRSHDVPVWSATQQTRNKNWEDSEDVRSVRLKIPREHIQGPGSYLQLGFQGRKDGDTTIKKVSIAEVDILGSVGAINDTTWTKVTFDGNAEKTWGKDLTTLPSGKEKKSDPFSFSLDPNKDYYVTIGLVTPPAFLDSHDEYQQLFYFQKDLAHQLDWTGFLSARGIHALSAVYSLQSGAKQFIITTPNRLPNGAVGEAYSKIFKANNGVTSNHWVLVSGELPKGVFLSSPVGIISGTPWEAGPFTFSLHVVNHDSRESMTAKSFALFVEGDCLPMTISQNKSLPKGIVGKSYSERLLIGGGTPPYRWKIESGNLPRGLFFNGNTGTIEGMPDISGESYFDVSVADSHSPPRTAGKRLSIFVLGGLSDAPTPHHQLKPNRTYVSPTQEMAAIFGDDAVEIMIRDEGGNVVYHRRKAGSQNLKWDGFDTQGRPVEPGMYVCKITGRDGDFLYQSLIILK